MERRRAVAIATATAATTLGAVAAIAANFGLLGFGQAAPSPVGTLEAGRVANVVEPPPGSPSAPGAGPNVTVRYEDVYLPAPTAVAPSAPAAATPATEATPGVQPTGDLSTPPADSGAIAAGDGGPPPADDQAEDEHSDDRYEGEDSDYEDDD